MARSGASPQDEQAGAVGMVESGAAEAVPAVRGAAAAGCGPCARPRRSRLSAEREAEIYGAVLALLCEVGYEALTMDAVAARTRASKATLYRKWQGKPRLVAAAIRHNRPFDFEGLDTGSLAGDLYELTTRIGQVKKDTDLVRAVVPAVSKDTGLAEAFRDLMQQDRTAIDAVFDQAVRRGEAAADCPARPFLPHLLLGSVIARSLIDLVEPDPAYLKQYVDAVILPALRQR